MYFTSLKVSAPFKGSRLRDYFNAHTVLNFNLDVSFFHSTFGRLRGCVGHSLLPVTEKCSSPILDNLPRKKVGITKA